MSSQNGSQQGGIHISGSSYHGNHNPTNARIDGSTVSNEERHYDKALEDPGGGGVDDNIYDDAESSRPFCRDGEGVYSDALSERPRAKGHPPANNYMYMNVNTNNVPKMSEITVRNTQLGPVKIPKPINKSADQNTPTNQNAAESSLDHSISSSTDSRIYDDVPARDSPADCFTESLTDTPKRRSRNLSDKDSGFVSYTQSLPPNFSLSGRKAEASLTGDDNEFDTEKIRTAKKKALTLRRRSSVEKGQEQDFQQEEKNGHWEDENIYESVYLQPHPGDAVDDYDDDDSDDMWSSDEFESYEDSIHNEATPAAAPIQVIMGPPASRIHKIHVAQGLDEPQYPSLLRRLKESFRGAADLSSGDEDSPCLPVEICDIKHPPPELPPLPVGLSNDQVKRRYAIGVLIDSEKSYISSIQRLLDDFKERLLEIPTLQRGKVRTELTKANEILQYHRMFQIELAEQVKLWHTQEKIGDVFTASFSKSIVLDAYSEYVNNFTAAMEDIKKVTRQRAPLRDYLKAKEMSSKDRLGLFGLMVKPVQRFPQFITCLQDLLKYTPHDHHDRLGLQRALTELENVAHKLNERKRESEQKLEAKAMLSNFKEHMITKTGYEHDRKLVRVDDLDQVVEASNKFKKRRLILLDDIIILTTVIPSRDGVEPERYKLKWCFPLTDVELKDSSLASSMQSSVRGEPGKITVVFAKPENPDEDPFHLVTDLSELHHDFSVLSNVVGLVSTLKRSYTGLSEESVHTLIRDLQRIIHVKDEQLRLVKSCSITLSVPCRTVTGGMGRTKYVFHTQSPSAREDWCLDLQIAKMALEARNNPGWEVPHVVDGISNRMPALFIKSLPVDVVRHYTKVRCAVPVFLSTPSNVGVGMQHLWVCNTTECRGQVSIVSIHSDRPRVIESYQACDCQILCVENVPGYSAVDSPYSFNMDTVWMVTVKAQVLIYQLTCSDGLTKRQPSATFTLPSSCSYLKYIDDRVFAALDDGQLAVYTRDDAGVWNVSSPTFLGLGRKPIKCLFPLDNHLLCTSGNVVNFVNIATLRVEKSHKLSPDDDVVIGHVARAGVGLWVSYDDQPLIHVYHLETLNQLQDVNVSSAVQKALTGKVPEDVLSSLTKDIQVSCLLASKGLLWIGTTTGVILTLPLPRLREGVPQIGSRPCVSFHGHCGPIRFLLPIFFMSPELNTLKTKAVAREYDYVAFKPSEKASTQQQVLGETSNSVNTPDVIDNEINETIEASGEGTSSKSDNNVKPEIKVEITSADEGPDHGVSQPTNMTNTELTTQATSSDSNPSETPVSKPTELHQSPAAKTKSSEAQQKTSHLSPNSAFQMQMRKDYWQSTPNLAADMDGTEDISVLYGSLMQGLDEIQEPSGHRRKYPTNQRALGKSQTLHASASSYDGSGKSKLHKHRRSRKRADSLSKEQSLLRVDEVVGQGDEGMSQSELPSSNSSTLTLKSSSELSSPASTLSLDKQQTSEDGNPSNYTIPADNLPTSPPGRAQSWGTTLTRKPVNACKSVIVVSGGDGYCNWNKPESNKVQRVEEATLLLWLHKVSS